MLRLVHDNSGSVPCPRCGGTGKTHVPDCFTANGFQAKGTGFPQPCPVCRGAKVAIGLTKAQTREYAALRAIDVKRAAKYGWAKI